jgi:hypothetical protein
MAVVRIEALRALAAQIEAVVPALAGKVKAGQASSSVEQTYPTLTLTYGPLTYEPAQELESATIGDPSAGVVVFNVGAHSGPCQLSIVATTVGERMQLEQDVVNVFLAREGAPGVVVVPVTTTPELGDWIAAFELTDDQWIDRDAFDRKLEALIQVNAVIPALVTRTDVYEIDELLLGLSTDFAAAPTSMTAPSVEVVEIHDDGTITPFTP